MKEPIAFAKENTKIKDAMAMIDDSRIVLVIDEDEKLIGTITDGDIRRALLRGFTLDDEIKTIYNPNPVTCSIHDSKETVLQTALKTYLRHIPIVDDERRVADVLIIEELLKPTSHTNPVIIMAGGLGSRLRPLTEHTPKPLLKIENRPILEKIVIDFVRSGFTNFIFCVNYKSDMIENHFGDGSDFGAKITYMHEKKRLGTAGALSLVSDMVEEPCIVINGDILTNLDFEAMLNHHIQSGSVATMGVREYEIRVPYGVVNVEEDRIVKIEEKPRKLYYVNAGIYVLDPEALKMIPKNEFFDMPDLFTLLLSKNKKCSPYPIREYWLDIGTIDDYEKANRDMEISKIMGNYRNKERK